MKELSLNILDIAENSIRAGATLVKVIIEETNRCLTFSVIDNGCGMSKQMLKSVTDPFSTTRTTRRVGLGIPLLKLAAEQTGGKIELISSTNEEDHGTTTRAVFYKDHIDAVPLGDIISTVCTFIQGSPNIDLLFTHIMPDKNVRLDTREVREVLGEGISLAEPAVIAWLHQYLDEAYNEVSDS